jgi:sugar lactone lactonase YvrE
MKASPFISLASLLAASTTTALRAQEESGRPAHFLSISSAPSAVSAPLKEVLSVVVDVNGRVFFSARQQTSDFVLELQTSGLLTPIAGTLLKGYSGDGAPAVNASLSNPDALATDSKGNLYIVDLLNQRVRKIDPAGVISTLAGNGRAGYSADGTAGQQASINHPQGVAVDASGNVYFSDTRNHLVRKISAAGVLSTVAGTGKRGLSGDGGPAVNAALDGPAGLAVDPSGNIYIADCANHTIRKVTSGGVISTLAGTGRVGFAGDDGPAAGASLSYPLAVALDAAGNLYIADTANQRIRKINGQGIITTIAGNGQAGFSGDGGLAIVAALNRPQGIATDPAGNLYIADTANKRLRKVSLGGTISTVAGSGLQGGIDE